MQWLLEQWGQIRGNVKWDISKWLGAIVLGGVYVALQRVRHLPPDWWVLGGLLGVTLVWLLIVSHDARRKAKSEKNTSSRSSPESSWLEELADEDAAKITERVIRISEHTVFHFDPGSDPYIEIVWNLLNASVFRATWTKVSGHTMYAGNQLAIAPQVFDSTGPPGPTFLSLKHGDSGILRIRQFISTDIADRMWADRNRNIAVDFSLVAVGFEAMGDTLTSFTLWGPRVLIADAIRNTEVVPRAQSLELGVDAADPQVYLQVQDTSIATVFTLKNRGKSVARHAKLTPLSLRRGTVLFTEIDLIEPDDFKNVPLIINEEGYFQVTKITRLLRGEWSTDGEPLGNEVKIPLTLTFCDFGTKRFEFPLELIYHPLWDTMRDVRSQWDEKERPVLEVKHGSIKRLS
jgi:hypothetical protein